MQRKFDWSARVLNIRNKILLGTVLLLSAMLIVAALLANGLRTLSEALRWHERAGEITAHLTSLDRLTGEIEAALHDETDNAARLQALLPRFTAKDGIAAELARLSELFEGDSAQMARLDQLRRRTEINRWRTLLSAGDAGSSDRRRAVEEIRAALEEIELAHARAVARARSEIEGLSNTLIINVAILCLLVIAITIVASQRLVRRLVDPVNQMMLAAERLMLGDLAPRVEERTGDEIGQLARTFNRMAERIAEREKAILARNQELDELHDFNALLQTSASEEEIHRALLQKVRTLELSQAIILNRQNEDNTLAVAGSLSPLTTACDDHGFDPGAEADQALQDWQRLPLCRVVRAGREIVVPDVRNDLLCTDCRFRQKRGSSFCMPITAGGRTIGALHLASPKTEYWTTERQRLVKALVDQAAPTINNLRLMKTLEDRTLMDEHTRVYNRRYLDDYLKQQIGLARRQEFPVSVMMLDIDHFKKLNDRYGHEAGDIVLRQFATTIKNSLREGEIIARYGGEEFTVVMNGTAKAAQTLAERLRRAVAALSFPQFAQQGEDVRVTMSIGIAEFPTNGQTVEDVLKSADFALYRAKDSGRNCVKLASRSLMAIRGAQISRASAGSE
ncbi:MAG TPA: diguanylate cyclase [Blastocatellia bacterium]|nr:diguanylate cyclase [Blastocatellia bacterium]